MAEQYVQITLKQWQELGQRIRRLEAEIARHRGGQSRQSPTRLGHVNKKFFARINGAGSQDGSNMRWKYAWVQIYKSAAGYGATWTDVPDGLSGTTTTNPAYNLNESANAATGVYGNGVDDANLTGTFDVVKIPDGTRVELTEVVVYPTSGDETLEYWITGYVSGVDGECA